ncbi:hypothetical protein QBC40DRAFT_286319 [Triangularia verruculosa]|uniref:Plasma membrane fusion protein PRM1 n=1 Tax=Triangularia verruculosa TaxID=2587418 RepID=A0AAN6XAN2_9PEZI|nr:hypothetical protein QBC40DRAFT_286319 [Triangularia verruculosa]
MFYDEKARAGGPPPVPPVPASLNANSWEIVDLDSDQQKQAAPQLQPHAHTDPTVTPYLGLRARLSQLWFNRWTVLLILVLVRVLLLTGSLNDNIGDAKVKALSACTKVEDVGSAMASMPHYLSVGVNALAAEGVEKAVSAMVHILMLILTGVENLIYFVINMYVGTWACLIAALIHGALEVGAKGIEAATKVMNDAIGTLTGQISEGLKDVQDVLDKARSGIGGAIGSIPGLGGGGSPIPIPTIDITKPIADLKNIKINSTELVDNIVKLDKKVPTFDQVENFTKNAIAIPFQFVKEQLNSSFGDYQFDKSVFPVAQKQALSFCSSNSFLNDFFQSLFEIVAKAKIAFLVAIPILATLAIIAMGWIEIRRWRKEKERAKVFTEHGFDPMDVVYIAGRPMTAGAGIWFGSRFGMSGRKNILVRWTVAYATSLPALFVLALAMAGFFSCFCQYLMLRAIQNKAPELANQVGNFAGDVIGTLQAVSTDWADGANGAILGLQDDINNDVLGYVTNATKAINNTLNTFDDEISKAVELVFKDTVLFNVAKDIVGCVILRKIDTVEKGLTWVHDHAKVTLPLFRNDMFSAGANDSVNGDGDLTSFLATPASVTTDEITDAVNKVVGKLQSGIIQEALISLALLLVYVIVVLGGVVYALVRMAQNDKTRGLGGDRWGVKPGTRPNSFTPGDTAANRQHQRDVQIDQQGGPDPYYDYRQEVVYAGSVKRGQVGTEKGNSHARKSSYPTVEDSGYSGR